MQILAIAVSWLIGVLLLHLLWPLERSIRLFLQLLLSVGLGVGATSCFLFLWLAATGRLRAYVWSEIVLLVLLAFAVWLRRDRRVETAATARQFEAGRDLERLVAAAFALVLVCSAAMFVIFSVREPHGLFDAVSMWNAKARLIFRSGGEWQAATSLYISHPDYPLLVPLSIARIWIYAGRESTTAQALLAGMFTFAIVGVLVCAVAALRTRTQGMLAGLVLLAPMVFLRFGSWQYADFPLASFALATLVLFCVHAQGPPASHAQLVLAGVMAGLTAWTKNEGLLFVVIAVAALALAQGRAGVERTQLRKLLWFGVGLLPLLVLIVWFKSQVETPNDLVAGQSVQSAIEKLTDITRYKLITKALLQQLVFFGGWELNPFYLLLLYPLSVGVRIGGDDRRGVLTVTVALALMFAGYVLVYLLTPRELPWHLETSLDRLLLHLWPGMVLLYFLVVRPPEEALAQVPAYHS